MNVKNNKRRLESIEKIEKAFIGFLQKKELNEITVSDICKMAELNRSTFYANFADIYELADKLKEHLEEDFGKLFGERVGGRSGAVMMFTHIKENQLFYKTYFKIGGYTNSYDMFCDVEAANSYFKNEHIDYHIEFFKSGLEAVIKKWLNNDCAETPEEMAEIIISEYQGR